MDAKQTIIKLEKEIHNITNQKKIKQNVFNYDYAKKEEEFSQKVNENLYILQDMKSCAKKSFFCDVMLIPSTIMILGGFANVFLGAMGISLLVYSRYKSYIEDKKFKQKIAIAKDLINEAKHLDDLKSNHQKEIDSLTTEQTICDVEKKRLENFVKNLEKYNGPQVKTTKTQQNNQNEIVR